MGRSKQSTASKVFHKPILALQIKIDVRAVANQNARLIADKSRTRSLMLRLSRSTRPLSTHRDRYCSSRGIERQCAGIRGLIFVNRVLDRLSENVSCMATMVEHTLVPQGRNVLLSKPSPIRISDNFASPLTRRCFSCRHTQHSS